MYKISEIISSPIITLYEGDNQGIIYNILFDTKLKIGKMICVLNENENIHKTLLVSNIYKIGKDCIFIKNSNLLDLKCCNDMIMHNLSTLINLHVYDFDGNLLGTCSDVIINHKLKIESIELNSGKIINVKNIINIGKKIILVNDSKISITRFKPLLQIGVHKQQENKVIILSDKNNTKINNNINNANKLITDSNFLIGRTIEKDIVAINGEIIAKKGTKITNEILKTASLYGKVIEIARYSTK